MTRVYLPTTLAGLHGFLEEVAATPDHELRRYLDERIVDLTGRLQTDPELAAIFTQTSPAEVPKG